MEKFSGASFAKSRFRVKQILWYQTAMTITIAINRIPITNQYFQTPADVLSTVLTLWVVDKRCWVVRSISSSTNRNDIIVLMD